MAGLKEMFLALQSRILNDVVINDADYPSFLTCELWNEQYIEQDNGTELSYSYPACFIDFPLETEYQTLGRGVVKSDDMIVRFHIVQEFYERENLSIFELRRAIIKYFSDFTILQEGNSGALGYISERRNTNNTNLWVWEFDFSCWYREDAGYVDQDQNEIIGVTLEVQRALKIDNDEIRTAKEF